MGTTKRANRFRARHPRKLVAAARTAKQSGTPQAKQDNRAAINRRTAKRRSERHDLVTAGVTFRTSGVPGREHTSPYLNVWPAKAVPAGIVTSRSTMRLLRDAWWQRGEHDMRRRAEVACSELDAARQGKQCTGAGARRQKLQHVTAPGSHSKPTAQDCSGLAETERKKQKPTCSRAALRGAPPS